MIEESPRITARKPSDLLTRAFLGVPVLTGAKLLRIEGKERVTGVVIERQGVEEHISCDGVIVSGKFVPEAAVLRVSHLAVDQATGGPVIDNFGRCSDPAFFASGNLRRPVEHSGAVALEARRTAGFIRQALMGELPEAPLSVTPGGKLRWVTPQRASAAGEVLRFEARAERPKRGTLRVLADGKVVQEKAVNALPERRLTIDVPCRRLRAAMRVEVRLD